MAFEFVISQVFSVLLSADLWVRTPVLVPERAALFADQPVLQLRDLWLLSLSRAAWSNQNEFANATRTTQRTHRVCVTFLSPLMHGFHFTCSTLYRPRQTTGFIIYPSASTTPFIEAVRKGDLDKGKYLPTHLTWEHRSQHGLHPVCSSAFCSWLWILYSQGDCDGIGSSHCKQGQRRRRARYSNLVYFCLVSCGHCCFTFGCVSNLHSLRFAGALFWASATGSTRMVSYLLELGANGMPLVTPPHAALHFHIPFTLRNNTHTFARRFLFFLLAFCSFHVLSTLCGLHSSLPPISLSCLSPLVLFPCIPFLLAFFFFFFSLFCSFCFPSCRFLTPALSSLQCTATVERPLPSGEQCKEKVKKLRGCCGTREQK